MDNRDITGLPFQPDVVYIKARTNQSSVLRTSTMAGDVSKDVGVSNGAFEANLIQSLTASGFNIGNNARVNSNGVIYDYVAFKSAPGYLQVGSYSGNGSTNREITGVGLAPAASIVFSSTGSHTIFKTKPMPTNTSFETRAGQSAVERILSLDNDGFTVNGNNAVNGSGNVYHYIAWAEVNGSMKQGTFTGNTSDNRNITGIGFQPDFVFLRAAPNTNQEPIFKMASTGISTDSAQSTINLANFANGIQALQADGFQVGTSVKANSNGNLTYWTAFAAGTTAPATTTTISATPDSAIDTGSGVNITVTMTVTATDGVTAITPSALTVIPGLNGANATYVSGPTNSPANIGSGGGSAIFTWVYNVTAGSDIDEVRFSGDANGTGAIFASATSNGVVVNDPPPSTTEITWILGSTLAAAPGNVAQSAPINTSTTLTSVKDNEIWNGSDKTGDQNTNYGTDPVMWVERTNDYRDRSLVEFDLSSIPANANITSANLRLSRKSGDNKNTSVSAHRLTQPWSETTSTWNLRSTGTPWTTPGGDGDYNVTPAHVNTTVSSNGFHIWPLTALTQDWVNGSFANYGVLLRMQDESVSGEHEFHTREASTDDIRPKLIVDYS